MNIIILIDSLSFGGSERSAQIMSNSLAERGIEVVIISLANIWKYPLNEGIKKEYIYNKNFSALKKLFLIKNTLHQVKLKIQEIQPDVVLSLTPQSNLINAILNQKKNRYKTITSERHFTEDYYGRKNIIVKPLVRWMHNRVDAVITNDIAIKKSLQIFYKIKTPIHVLNNLFDTDNMPAFTEISNNQTPFTYITVGRLSKEKNTKDAIKAFSLMEDSSSILRIIGDGPLMQELKDWAAELNVYDRIQFLGHQSNPFEFLHKADVFIFTSLNEGFPNVILEAMSCGLPIISYHFKSGINTILKDGENGILIPIGEVQKFSKAMQDLKENSVLHHYYKERSKITIKEFSDKKKYITNLLNIIENL